MRVVAGEAAGRRLRLPRGTTLRPTADRTKEALFSMIESLLLRGRPDADVGTPELWAGLRIADLYAGSGGLGIEALSRGAAAGAFFERDRGALAAIAENLRATGLADRATVVPGEVGGTLDKLPAGVELVLLDPPYADPAVSGTLARVAASPALAADAIVALEHGQRLAPPGTLGALVLQRSRRHGDTVLTLYARGRYDRRGPAEVV
ncbi:MAG TPA: RsmD family RNA methyltransferase [Chloroflexota bacterium]|jgi:16S rRNA (guanine966-N2)-methyltransferase|nr:RsmD family RNA methyltransferase [Chloroflexota bacterium]